LHLSFALSDPARVERLFLTVGFRETRVTHETHEAAFPSFDDYWAPVEEATGVMPQAYRALPEPQRRAVRKEVRTRLAPFEASGRLVMSLEMLIATGRA
jgi:ferric-dicitrate binding protein FerR (iron transport regulator)